MLIDRLLSVSLPVNSSGLNPSIVQGSTVYDYRTKTKTNESKGVTKQN